MDISGNLMSVGFGGIPGLVESGGIFLCGVDIGGILMSVEFGRISGLVEPGGFLRCGVNIGGNFRLVDLSGFFGFWFGVGAVSRGAFLLADRLPCLVIFYVVVVVPCVLSFVDHCHICLTSPPKAIEGVRGIHPFQLLF